MAVRIQLRRDTASNWETNNPVLALGEIGLDTTSGNFKIGNGTSQWTQLNYFSTEVEDVISEQQLNDAIAAIGGDGIVFDSEEGIYNLDLSSISQNIIPETTETYDLGSDSKRWNDLYLSGDTIFLGDIQLKDSGDGKFEVLSGDGETTLETALLPGQVTDAELSDDAADLKTRFATHRDATDNPHLVTAEQVGLGNVTNESKTTMFNDPTFTGNVSGVTKVHVGLGNVDNTSDANKPISTATQSALDQKEPANSNIQNHISSTENPHGVNATQVGLGNVTNESKETMFTNPTFTGTVSGVTATMVGLGNVTNESKTTMFTNAALTGVPTAPTATATTNTTQIATTEFVQGEINAAALALGTNYSVADITERDNLTGLVVGDIVFVADNGDSKWAQYKVTSIDPVVFLKIMDQDIMLNALSAPDIKTAYESNPNTNAFTDLIKTRFETTGTIYKVENTTAANNIANLVVGDVVFITDAGDGKWALYICVDAIEKLFVLLTSQIIVENTNTTAALKVAYESNDDTNAFTDALKTKLETTDIFDDSGTYLNLRAQATTATDVGLGNVTNESKATMFNDPNFTGIVSGVTAEMVGLGNVTNESKETMFLNPTFTGTVSGITAEMVGLGNVTNDLQATKNEFDNHVGDSTIHFTQASILITESQISDLQNYELADPTILKSADIGSLVQGFDINTVIDENYETFNSSEAYPNLRAQATTAEDVGLGNVTNQSKETMFTDPVFTGTVSGITSDMVGLGNVTNESKTTMFTDPTFTGTVSGVTAAMVGLGNVTNESKATMFTNAALTEIPTAPTAAFGTDTTQIATTAFVQAALEGAQTIDGGEF